MNIVRHKVIIYSIKGTAMEVHRELEAVCWNPFTTRHSFWSCKIGESNVRGKNRCSASIKTINLKSLIKRI